MQLYYIVCQIITLRLHIKHVETGLICKRRYGEEVNSVYAPLPITTGMTWHATPNRSL